MGRIGRLAGLEKGKYHAAQLPEKIETTGDGFEGRLLEVTPNPENNGPGSMASVYESLWEPATAPVQSFEIWFHGGEARFFFLADSPGSADTIRRTISDNYPDSVVEAVDPTDEWFPTITPADSVVGAHAVKHHPEERHDHLYLPIAYFADGDGWPPEQMPIAELISAMQAGKETSVVLQVTFKALPASWTNKTIPFFDESSETIKQDYRENGETDYKRMVEKQTVQSPFAANIRVLAVSPDEVEARNRASAVAGKLERKYISTCGMRLTTKPVYGRTDGRQRTHLKKHINRMRNRVHHPATDTVLGNEEMTALHIPQKEAGAPGIGWKYARSGSDAPVERPEHSVPNLDDVDDADLPIMGDSRSGDGGGGRSGGDR